MEPLGTSAQETDLQSKIDMTGCGIHPSFKAKKTYSWPQKFALWYCVKALSNMYNIEITILWLVICSRVHLKLDQFQIEVTK